MSTAGEDRPPFLPLGAKRGDAVRCNDYFDHDAHGWNAWSGKRTVAVWCVGRTLAEALPYLALMPDA